MATDPHGNVYLVSNVGGQNLSVDGTSLNFHFPADYYGTPKTHAYGGLLMSYDCDGNFRWSKLISGSWNTIKGIEADTLGNIYINTYSLEARSKDIWGTEYPAYFDTDSIIPYSDNLNKYQQSIHMIQYDTLGNMKHFHSPEPDSIHRTATGRTFAIKDMMVDPDGTQHYAIYARNYTVGGPVLKPVIEGDTLLPGEYILKYDVQGNYLGNKKLEMELTYIYAADGLFDFKLSHDPVRKAYYMTGYNSTPHIGNHKDSLWVGGQLVDSPMFVAKFDSLGNHQWLKQGSPSILSSNAFYEKAAVDHQGNIYLGANFQNNNNNPVTFNGYTPQYQNPINHSFPGIIKMDGAGNLLWGSSATSVDAGLPAFTNINVNNYVSVTNSHGGIQWGNYGFPQDPNSGYDIFHARFDTQTGAIISMDTLASNYGVREYSTAMASDKRGNVYIGGRFQGQLYVGQDTLTNIHGAGTDYFIAKAGEANCNCSLPEAGFSYTGSNGTVNFTYTGTAYDSLEWGFDDGTVQTGTTNAISHTYTEDREYWICVTAYNSCGYDTWCTLVEPFALTTESLTAASFSFYPNPVKEVLNIDAQEALTYNLYDLVGKSIQQGKLVPGTNRIDTHHLPSGFYMLQVKNPAGSQRTVKVVKE